ncbi:MAG TPA: PRC-barrel domain-containing protein [Galbitalea sp.]|nr:PRC-barrel domain-containing protein [Galbitalea sp.]
MTDIGVPLFVRLRDTGQTIADPRQDVRGRTVTDATGMIVGKITALIVDDKEWKVRLLQITSGGRWGARTRTAFLPVEAIHHISSTNVQVDRASTHVSSGPRYDPQTIDQIALFARTYGHYNVAPYWDWPLDAPASSAGARNQSTEARN